MMVVTVVLVLAAVMITPSLISMKKTSDRRDAISAIRRIVPDARERAIQSGKTTQVVVDDSANELQIQQVEDDGTTTVLTRDPIPNDLQPQKYQLNGKDSTASDFKLTFTPDGHSIGGGMEFQDFSIYVDRNGVAKWIDGPLPAPDDQQWQAGDLEQRQQTGP